MPFFDYTLLFVEPTILALLLVYAYGFFGRGSGSVTTINMMMGGIFGLCAVAAMLAPIEIADGVIVDMRNLFVGLAAAFLGLVGGVIALTIGCITRIFLGGAGMTAGLLAMSMAGGMGLAWARWVRPRISNDTAAFVLLGCCISGHLVVGLILPATVRNTFFSTMAPTLFLANLLGAYLLGKLITRERAFVTERDKLRSAISVDPLTGLMNRNAAISGYANLPKAKDPSCGAAMLCIDVDFFKVINDTHGHLRGDQVLVDIAQRMTDCLRPHDIFSRMSGDEFVIVLNDLTAEQARAVAGRCQRSVTLMPVVADGAEIDVSVSIGCSWVARKPDFNVLRNAADQALYRAKANGRNCLTFETMSPAVRRDDVSMPLTA